MPTPIYTAFSLLQLPHGLATTTHNHSRRGHYIYIYIYIYMSFSQTVFCLANLVSSVCPTPLAQMFDRLLRSTPAPAHEGTRLRSTRGYTRAQAPRCDARAPAVSRRHRTPHSETSPADPNPTELIAPPPPHELVWARWAHWAQWSSLSLLSARRRHPKWAHRAHRAHQAMWGVATIEFFCFPPTLPA